MPGRAGSARPTRRRNARLLSAEPPAADDAILPPMLQHINVGHKKLGDYASLVGRRLMDQIQRLAEPLEGKRVLHLSATAFGGGVAEINYTLMPLMVDAGLEAEWRVIWGQEEFFQVTKTIHNALQGSPEGLDEAAARDLRRLQPAQRRGARRTPTTSSSSTIPSRAR